MQVMRHTMDFGRAHKLSVIVLEIKIVDLNKQTIHEKYKRKSKKGSASGLETHHHGVVMRLPLGDIALG